MNKMEAQGMIGQRVKAWTAMNGSYTGILVQVISEPRRPWRGVVLIDGVLEVAAFQNRGIGARPIDRQRAGFRPGQEIEVGGVNIAPTTLEGSTYLEALERALARLQEWANDKNTLLRNSHWLLDSIEARKIQIKKEKHK